MNCTEEIINVEEKKPVKSKRLKLIAHIGSIYATFDGRQIWEIDRGLSYILGLCDGTRTEAQIADEIAKEININIDDAKSTLSNILKEFESKGFIEYL
ncbi:MAG: PqqD family protein [Fervidobacterium sp.]